MPNYELHVVLGASGGIGNALACELAAPGKRVRDRRTVRLAKFANVPAHGWILYLFVEKGKRC